MSDCKLWKALKKEYAKGFVGGRPYFCKICGADGIRNKKDLYRHLWTHFSEQKTEKGLIDLMAGLAVEGRSEDADAVLSKKMESLKLRQREKFERKKNQRSSKSKKIRSSASSTSSDPGTPVTPTEVKPKKCSYPGCETAFNDRKLRRRHFLGHGEPMFGCKVCGKKFTRKDNRSRHVKVVHGQSRAVVQEPPQLFHNFFDDEYEF